MSQTTVNWNRNPIDWAVVSLGTEAVPEPLSAGRPGDGGHQKAPSVRFQQPRTHSKAKSCAYQSVLSQGMRSDA